MEPYLYQQRLERPCVSLHRSQFEATGVGASFKQYHGFKL